MGTTYLLDVWGGLRARLEPGKFWQAPDRFQAIRLLGRQPIDARFDEACAAIFYASAKLERGKPEPFSELRSDLDADQLTELRKEVAKRFPELAALEDRTECRQILLDIVDRNVERLHEILKTHEENADAEAERVVARKGFDNSPRGKQLKDYELKYHRELRQSIVVYEKLTGERRGAWNGKDETWRGGSACGEPIAPPPPYGTKSDEHCMGPAGKPAGRGRSVRDGFGGVSNESAPATGIAVGGTPFDGAHGGRRDPDGSGGERNRAATRMVAGGSRFDGAHGGRSEPAPLGREERGWESVRVEAEDFVACQGFLPERLIGVDGDGRDGDAGVDGAALCEDTDLAGGVTPLRLPPTVAGGGTSDTKGEESATNEPKLDPDVLTTQNKENVEVVANSGDFSRLDQLRTNPRPGCGGKKRKVQNRNPKLQIPNRRLKKAKSKL